MDQKNILTIISNETKDEICKLDFVTPEIFSSIFLKKAQAYKIENLTTTKEYLHQEVENFLELQDSTSKQANELSVSTTKAIQAIKDQNVESLQEVLVQTQHLKKEIEKLKQSLYKDDLTGVYNRKWMYEHIVDGSNNMFFKDGVLVVVDLNYFKMVNDRYGHIIGDKVLIFIASELQKTGADVIRYGGDEFLIVFPPRYTSEAVEIELLDLRKRLLKKSLKAKNATFHISFSFGIVAFKRNEEFCVVVDKADQKMYEDKKNIKKKITGIDG